ncbi:choice-of-anchor P family protein [Ktedonospora formicarum]|uniref:choice-of-anchor P family protein n=1 Tax=Ktedonospora formicarum TaxID=2778364 RepID=UPI001C691D07|nr:choice-of-anchor P family protein [Ktedonospora formicarum]
MPPSVSRRGNIITLNEQTVPQDANQLLMMVNALHFRIITGPQAGTDIVVGHAEAGITLS